MRPLILLAFGVAAFGQTQCLLAPVPMAVAKARLRARDPQVGLWVLRCAGQPVPLTSILLAAQDQCDKRRTMCPVPLALPDVMALAQPSSAARWRRVSWYAQIGAAAAAIWVAPWAAALGPGLQMIGDYAAVQAIVDPSAVPPVPEVVGAAPVYLWSAKLRGQVRPIRIEVAP